MPPRASLVLGLIVVGAARLPAAPAPAVPPDAVAAAYCARIEAGLRDDILAFWMQHVPDRERGGFYGRIGLDMKVQKDAPRGALLPARILWTFSAAYRQYRDPAYLEMARWACADLLEPMWDDEHGGLYWMVSADGEPQDMRKSTYIQVFGIYGFSEYHRATGDPVALERAIQLFRLVEQHAHDRENGGYHESFNRDWTPRTGARRSAMELPGPKSQNTNLHVMEAFTNLLRVWPDPELKAAQASLIDTMLTRFLDAESGHLRLFLTDDWQPRSDAISFGHDIEFSWLVTEAAEVLGDPELLVRAQKAAVHVAEVTLREAVDADGALLYEAGPKGITNTMKEWWPQAETVVGFLNAWQLTGDEKFLRAALAAWDFIESHLVDREHGEWYRVVTRDGKLPRWQEKVGYWKCPYHNGRACMEALRRLCGPRAP